MRLRLPELLTQHEMTAYELAKRSRGRISLSSAYRLADGTKSVLRLEEIAALCEVLEVEPGELFSRERPSRGSRRRT